MPPEMIRSLSHWRRSAVEEALVLGYGPSRKVRRLVFDSR